MKKVLSLFAIVITLILSMTLFTSCSTGGRSSNNTLSAKEEQTNQVETAIPTAKPTSTKKPTAEPTATKRPSTSTGLSSSSKDTLATDEFWCMGKNDTCKNKTEDAWDLYCSSCDRNGNNVEDSYEK